MPSSLEAALPIRTSRLPNGMRVVLCESRGAPVVALQVWVEAGSADEREEEGGLAHVHEHMLFKGTKTRGVGEIASEIEAAGGEINAWTSYDQTVYHVVLASEFFDTAIGVLADAVQHSAFDEGELSRELEVILEEIKRAEDQPASRVSRALFEQAFTRHPYARPVIGKSEVVQAFDREQVLRFFRSHYRADRLTVVATGDFDTGDALSRIEKAFGTLSAGAAPLPDRPQEPPQTAPRVRSLSGDVEEAHLAIGFKGPSLSDDDLAAVDVLSVLLGQGESSRLTDRLRRKEDLVNEIYAYAYTPRDAGLFVVGASLNEAQLRPALEAIGQELGRLLDEPPTPAEVEKAKTILCSEAIYQRETVEGLARRIGFWTTMTGDPRFELSYQSAVRDVTPEDITEAARRYLGREKATVVTLSRSPPADEELARLVDETLPPSRAPTSSQRARSAASAIEAEWRTAPPAGPPVRMRQKLSSGATILIEPDGQNPIVTVRAVWLGGARSESAADAGLSHLLADLWVRGTSTRSAEDIAAQVDSMAGRIDALAGRNSLGLRATFLREHFDEGFRLFADCLNHPSFPDDELERSKRLTLEDLRSRADNPPGLCFELFARALWLEHPYRRDVLGTPTRVASFDAGRVRDFYARRIDPTQAVVAFVGDITPDEAMACAEAAFSRGTGTSQPPTSWAPPAEAAPAEDRVARLDADRAQAHLVLGHRGLALDDDDRFALEILCAALSGQGGRLFLELRDKQSLCYAVSAFSIEGIEPGSFAVYMGTSPHKMDTALAGITQLLDEVRAHGLTPVELDRARKYLIGAHGIGLQRLGARGSTMAYNELYGLGFLAHTEAAARYQAVTGDDIRRVAERILGTPRVTAIVGPSDTAGPAATLDGPALMKDDDH